ncbi:MAG: MFS transporter [Gammaproteobacteria bacterium]|nr:MFS transporter [Gammaproteobacteria bacterium]
MSHDAQRSATDALYDLATGDEDARVCRDIPDAACRHLPRNFFSHLIALVATKTGDRLAGARLVLAWLLTTLGAPPFMTALLVPIRESLALLPQLAVAAFIRRTPVRKWFWIAGSVAQGLCILAMAAVAATLQGGPAGWAILGLLIVFSLARGVCSVSSKDVMGKTVSKNRRGTLTGYAASAAGAITVAVGLYLGVSRRGDDDASLMFFIIILSAAGALWLLAAFVYSWIKEEPGATEGGGNAATEALSSLRLLYDDAAFRHFVITRTLLISTALAAPFFVMLANRETGGALSGLALMIVANGLAAWISAPFWGRFADRSSRRVLVVTAAAAAGLGGLVVGYSAAGAPGQASWVYAGAFFVLGIIHTGVRVGRKTYLVDMATQETRATYVAVSNTVIGVFLLVGSVFGVLAEYAGIHAAIAALSVLAAAAAFSALRLAEVQ